MAAQQKTNAKGTTALLLDLDCSQSAHAMTFATVTIRITTSTIKDNR